MLKTTLNAQVDHGCEKAQESEDLPSAVWWLWRICWVPSEGCDFHMLLIHHFYLIWLPFLAPFHDPIHVIHLPYYINSNNIVRKWFGLPYISIDYAAISAERVLISQWYKLSKHFLLVSIGCISFLHRVLRPPGGGSSFTLGGGDDPPPKATQSPAAPSPVAAAAGAPTPDKPSEQNCESYRDRLYGGGSTAEVKTKSGGNPKNMGKWSY